MLNGILAVRRVILCCGRVDLRRGIDGLSTFVHLHYGFNTLEKGTMFLFCGTRADRIKGLVFLGYGWCLVMIRLSPGNRFQWPRTPEEAKEISPEQFRRLMDGYTIEGTISEAPPKESRKGPSE